MKKAFILVLILLFLVALVGCDGSTYKKAAEAIAISDFGGAQELLDTIPDYEDKDGLRDQINRGLINEAIMAEDFASAQKILDAILDFKDEEGFQDIIYQGIIQQAAEEYIIHLVDNGGYYVPTSIKVLKAGYNSADNGDRYANVFEADGIFYFTIQAGTKGGGTTSGDTVILYGGDQDKEIMTNNDPGNDYDACEISLNVKALNETIKKHWEDLGVGD